MTEFNPNAVAASVFTDLAKELMRNIFHGIPEFAQNKYKTYFENFEESLKKMYIVCFNVRTIINKDEPVPLDNIYVKGKYKCGDRTYNDDELCQIVRDGQRVVVTGFGGIGKTVFCKYLWLSIYREPGGKIPIFFELRNLNDITKQDIEAYVRISLTISGKTLPEDIFRELMRKGRFIFILDAFDEIPDDNRFEIQRQIIELAHQYPSCGFVVSSRSDDRFHSWHEFYHYAVKGFDKKQSKQVIEKVTFDSSVKKEFLQEIHEKRYEDYKEFFATPLLTLMMLMTYLQIRYIPDSPHIFYRYAFQTLYTLHDASKQGFQRKRYVDMSEAQFINIFSLFCLVSYIEMEHTFEYDTIIRILDSVKKKIDFEYDSDGFLKESVESVNLIFKEGDKYSFTHRSFQEYFTAYAADHYFPSSFRSVIERIPVRDSDSVFPMLRMMNSYIFNELYLIPVYDTLKTYINKLLRERENIKFLALLERETTFVFQASGPKSGGYPLTSIHSRYRSELSKFSAIICASFKSELPKGVSANLEFHIMKEEFDFANRFVRRFVRIHPRRSGDEFIIVSILHKTGNVRVSYNDTYFLHDEKYSPVEEFSLYENIRKEEYIFEQVATSLKAQIVFVKKRCDQSIRDLRSKESSGIDVLDL